MLTIKLVRHGESHANLGLVTSQQMGDHLIPLSERGQIQAREAGRTIGSGFIAGSLVYVSPYLRTRETLANILEGCAIDASSVRVYEDPRLREVEHGYDEVSPQGELRERHGWFYYRFRGGESPADCYDRASTFLESMMRQVERKAAERVLVVTHGLFIRCFAMRFLHLSVETFDTLANPHNCDVVTIGEASGLTNPQFTSGRWGVEGLRLRP
ncbi:MAG: histidine phosphatase family protein [Kofleriaceae bacterium]